MKDLRISIELPQDVSAEEFELARVEAVQGAIISLWQAGRFSTREAAGRLGLTYYDYIDLLGKRGIPVVTGISDEQALQDMEAEIRARYPSQ